MKISEIVLSGFLIVGYVVAFLIPGVKEIPYLFESLDIMLVAGLFLLPFLVMLHTNRFWAKVSIGGFGIYALAVLFYMQHWPGARILWIAFPVYLGGVGLLWSIMKLSGSPRFPNTWHLLSGLLLIGVCVVDFMVQVIEASSVRIGLYSILLGLLITSYATGKKTDELRPTIWLAGVVVTLSLLRSVNWMLNY